MTRNDALMTLDVTMTDVLDLAGVDRAALARLDLATISVRDLTIWLRDHGAANLNEIERIELAEFLTRRRFIIGAGGLLGAAALGACGAAERAGSDATEQEATSGCTRLIRHYLGETRVPVNPQRIVVTDHAFTLGALVSVDIIPYAAGSFADFTGQDFNPVLYPRVEGVEPLPTEGGVPLEQVAALEPDLIIGFGPSRVEPVYDQLSEIAPTVPIDSGPDIPVSDYMATVAEVVGRTELLQERMAELDARIASLGEELPEIGTVSIITIWPEGEIAVWKEPYKLAQFVSSLGGEVVPTFSELGVEQDEGDTNPRATVSLELLPEVNGETLFLSQITSNEEEGDHLEEIIQSNPLWQQLPAVQNDRVYTFNRGTASGLGGIPGWQQIVDRLAEIFGQKG